MKDMLRTNRQFIIAMCVVVVLWTALLPLILLLDRHTDRQRPMYEDVDHAAYLQYLEVRDGGHPVSFTVRAPDSVDIGEQPFQPSDGVTVQSEPKGTGYCVEAHNRHGDRAARRCWDGTTNPQTMP
jgi:hypothetical protein